MPRHCDNYIDDPEAPAALRAFLAWARSPAHGMLLPEPHPRLFATVVIQSVKLTDTPDLTGRRVRVTMASRFGHVGVSVDHSIDHGYHATAWVEQLADFSSDP